MSNSDRLPQYGVVLVTAPAREQAEAIAQALIAAKLAACVSLLPIYSMYTWQGKVERGDEWQLLIKTELSKFAALEAIVHRHHPYEVPEIIALPILAGSLPYLQWISEQVGGAGRE
ncbi:divalent-cation tolerance protein CutA [Pantanalinema sp. GBBB05]|uniref:divalent-cation tolerance protein CutA n=1 Tax=Pantanalinema sp. GBBB05 TaxID=2604139 RepID=UPI001DD3C170|nr:divalent-cation tolerance protein CutA [Pantanalinema sp. GBBB05]